MTSKNAFLPSLVDFIGESERLVMVIVGNILKSDDGAGLVLHSKYLKDLQLPSNWRIINAENMPENFISPIREWNPSHIIVIDAIEASLEPGTIKLFSNTEITNYQKLSTHAMPLTLLLEVISNKKIKFLGIGIQIKSADFGIETISSEVSNAVDELGIKLTNLFASKIK